MIQLIPIDTINKIRAIVLRSPTDGQDSYAWIGNSNDTFSVKRPYVSLSPTSTEHDIWMHIWKWKGPY